MNDFLARELIDVLKHMAASQRLIEMHLAEIRTSACLIRHEMDTDYRVSEEFYEWLHGTVFSDREMVEHYHDTK
jgi:hypothetical protein